jgi:hypothetical protein
MTTSEREAAMERARAKRQGKSRKKNGPPAPAGVVEQVKDVAASAAKAVGAAVKSAVGAIGGMGDPQGSTAPADGKVHRRAG